jgi:hypothetical protein
MKALLCASLIALLPACAAAPRAEPGPRPLMPVGRYDAHTIVNGQAVTIDLEITGTAGAYAGRLGGAGLPTLPLQTVSVEGRELLVTAATPDGPIVLRLVFAGGDEFTGSWSFGGQTGELAGRRLPSAP